jgi:hypothetical protein
MCVCLYYLCVLTVYMYMYMCLYVCMYMCMYVYVHIYYVLVNPPNHLIHAFLPCVHIAKKENIQSC